MGAFETPLKAPSLNGEILLLGPDGISGSLKPDSSIRRCRAGHVEIS